MDLTHVLDYLWAVCFAVVGWFHTRLNAFEAKVNTIERDMSKEYVRKEDFLRTVEDFKDTVKEVKSGVKDVSLKLDNILVVLNTKQDKE